MIQYYEDGDVAVFDNLVFRRDKKTDCTFMFGNIATEKFQKVMMFITRILIRQTMRLIIFNY